MYIHTSRYMLYEKISKKEDRNTNRSIIVNTSPHQRKIFYYLEN